MKNKLLWKPTQERVKSTSLYNFIEYINSRYQLTINNFDDMHTWSIENRENFCDGIWDFYKIIGIKGDKPFLEPKNDLPGTRFFPNGKLNYAENMLKKK